MQIKKTGTTKVSFKVRCGKKIYNCKTTVKVVKYANPFKKILLDNTDITKLPLRHLTAWKQEISVT